MQVINYGTRYEIYPNDLKTFDELPAGTYDVNFSKMSGFSLSKIDDFEQKEEKIYGDQATKVEKVMKAYNSMNRSLGVIMSGKKGIGKSLFTQLMAEEVISKGMPVILVKNAYPGIASFLDTITSECLILFDEFEKIFSDDEEGESQNKLLGLFDGTSQYKRLYMITVNNLNKVNDYMLNRPGRFHYHFVFNHPSEEEIEEYLTDKLDKEFYSEIKKVQSFSVKVPLNYDCLRAIAFELNLGLSFEEAISDLNITKTEQQLFNGIVKLLKDGIETIDAKVNGNRIDLFSPTQQSISFYCNYGGRHEYGSISFMAQDVNIINGEMVISGSDVELSLDYDNEVLTKGNVEVTTIILEQQKEKEIHYAI